MENKARLLTKDEFLRRIADAMPKEKLAESVVKMEIADTIRRSRVSLGLTQKQFSEKMNVTQGLVSRWESGKYNFSVDSLVPIALFLGLDVQNPLQTTESYVSSAEDAFGLHVFNYMPTSSQEGSAA